MCLVCVGLALTASCKKDNTDSSAGSTRYLQRFITTEGGSSITYTLTYDNKNRLVAYNSDDDEYQSKVTYDGHGNAIKFELESEGTKQIFEISYNSSGVPISAISSLFNPETPEDPFETEIAYEVTNGKINQMLFTDETGHESVYELRYTENNLTAVTYTSGGEEFTITWKHGTKKSPFSAAQFKYLVIPDLFSVFSNENEITETIMEIPGLGTAVTQKEEYQYDAEGYLPLRS